MNTRASCAGPQPNRLAQSFFQLLESRHHVLVNSVGLLMQMGDLEFGFDIHLVLNISSHLVFFRLPVLADQDKARQENSLQRNNHGQQTKRKRIEGLVSEDNGIERDPDNKPDGVRN